MVAGVAVVTAIVVLMSGALDDKRTVDLDVAAAITSPPAATDASPNRVASEYLAALSRWSTCVGGGTASTAPCEKPEQPDDPQLTAYVVAVTDWNKCAAPRLRHGGLKYAIEACGAEPVLPAGG